MQCRDRLFTIHTWHTAAPGMHEHHWDAHLVRFISKLAVQDSGLYNHRSHQRHLLRDLLVLEWPHLLLLSGSSQLPYSNNGPDPDSLSLEIELRFCTSATRGKGPPWIRGEYSLTTVQASDHPSRYSWSAHRPEDRLHPSGTSLQDT